MQRFVDEHGEDRVLSEKRMHPELRTWHYGLNALGKETIGDFLRLNAGPSDVDRWIKLLELIRARVGLTSNASPAEGAPVSRASTNLVGVHLPGNAEPNADVAPLESLDPAERRLDPWRVDGRAWHLEQNCSPKSRPIAEAIVEIVGQAVPELSGPHWNQRNYVSWKAHGRVWLSMHPRTNWVWVTLNAPYRSADEIAADLGMARLPHGTATRMASDGPSQVMGAPDGPVYLHLKHLQDVTSNKAERLTGVIRAAWLAYQGIRAKYDALASQKSESGLFDWSRIDAVVSAIPRGRWTSYGDLALLAGTHAQPVGVHVASFALPNGYRVLDHNGRVAPGFRWADPSDNRDVTDVLKAEGVMFDETGCADPTQRLSSEDLLALLTGGALAAQAVGTGAFEAKPVEDATEVQPGVE